MADSSPSGREDVPGTHYLSIDKVWSGKEIAALYDAEVKKYEALIEADKAIIEGIAVLNNFNSVAATSRYPSDRLNEILPDIERQLQDVQSNLLTYQDWRDAFMANPSTFYFAKVSGRDRPYLELGPDGYTELKPGDRVYNKDRKQIWPPSDERPASKPRQSAQP